MDEINWIKQQAQELSLKSQKYEDRAFYKNLESLTDELITRIEQKQAELDGRIWNHKGW
ncbi:hypothetical protein [Companilactobacillus sp. DQM5]|uniref:hypothetical protein n=1 Tax=Companilactobacillus sp. DQM5 TaxID=3463359 RepID=UPI004059FB60